MNKKEQIIKSALELFCEKGFAETDIDSVAKKAGVGKGTVYLYFKDKKDLFVSSTTYALNHFNNDLEKTVETVNGASEKLKIYIDHSLSILTSNKNITRLFITEVLETMRKCSSRDRLFDNSIFTRRFTFLKGILESGIKSGEFKKVDRDSLAVMIMGGIQMIMTKYIVFTGKVNKKEISTFRESVLQLIKKEK
ncbi:MAG: TetR/AcrR family transcriptional regulator [bacterium]